jgi:basic membrane lipoprotein Med (substrate-binding protein (PBP1-ABC) superfamily)
VLCVVLALGVLATACGDDDDDDDSGATAAGGTETTAAGAGEGAAGDGPTELNVAMIFLNTVEEPYNTSFLQSWDRLKAEQPHGLTIDYSYTENVAAPDAERVLRELASSGEYDMIWAHSTYWEAVQPLKDEFPDILWGYTGSGNEGLGGNTYWLDVFVHEPAYLMGIIAGMMTETDTIGAVAAFPFPNVNMPLNSYIAGAESVNPEVQIKATYLESWFDPAKGRESAAAQLEAGADFIYAERFGPFEAVAEKEGSYAFGHFVDQSSLAPEIVVTSAIAKWDPAILVAIDDWYAHETTGSAFQAPTERVVFTMKDGGADLAPYNELEATVPDDVKAAVDEAKAAILDGSLTVPMNEAEVESD